VASSERDVVVVRDEGGQMFEIPIKVANLLFGVGKAKKADSDFEPGKF
jgi:hypothetical protein